MKLLFCACLLTALIGAEGATYSGTIFADNWFKLWVNGIEVAIDQVTFLPHQATTFTFEDSELCRTYAIYTTDFADDETGLEYDDTCIGDGGIRIVVADGTVSNASWQYYTIHYGPYNWDTCFSSDPSVKCLDEPATGCNCTEYEYAADWCSPQYNDTTWTAVTTYTDQEVGWGRQPNSTEDTVNCVDPRTVEWGDSEFIWAGSLDFDNRVLLRYTVCDEGGVYPEVNGTSWTCDMDRPTESLTCNPDETTDDSGTYVKLNGFAVLFAVLIFMLKL